MVVWPSRMVVEAWFKHQVWWFHHEQLLFDHQHGCLTIKGRDI
jgi:hypothetical protein